MKRIFISMLFFILVCSNPITAEEGYVKTTMDNNRFEMLQISYSAYAYNIKFDKWTGNISVYTKDGVFATVRDSQNTTDIQNKQCIYQLMKGYKDSIEHCYIINTVTGEVWEVSFKKGGIVQYEKME